MKSRFIISGLFIAIIISLEMTGMHVVYAQKAMTVNQTDQAADYQVVFDITSKDAVAQNQVLRDAGLIRDAHPDAQVEVVLYGQSLDLILKDKSSHADDVKQLIAKGVSFKVCHIAMDHHNITESQLISGVGTVPDGIYEIISKQKQGWGYIKITP
jgi:intracellular sulfur oxidation DsrE/DsrF family protein